MEVLKAIMVPGSKGPGRLLSTLALTWIFIFLLCLNSYAGDAQDLVSAAKKDDISTVKALLAKGADVNAKDKDGVTALMWASGKGHLDDVAQALLAKGADVNAKEDKAGMTALMVASFSGRLEIAQALLAKGADVNTKDNIGVTALMFASTEGHLDVVQALLAKGADVNAKVNNGATALSIANANGYNDVAQLLIKAGAKESPLPIKSSNSKVEQAKDIYLSGIMYDNRGNSTAVINDKIALEGDLIEGYTVKAIKADTVTLVKDGRELELSLNQARKDNLTQNTPHNNSKSLSCAGEIWYQKDAPEDSKLGYKFIDDSTVELMQGDSSLGRGSYTVNKHEIAIKHSCGTQRLVKKGKILKWIDGPFPIEFERVE